MQRPHTHINGPSCKIVLLTSSIASYRYLLDVVRDHIPVLLHSHLRICNLPVAVLTSTKQRTVSLDGIVSIIAMILKTITTKSAIRSFLSCCGSNNIHSFQSSPISKLNRLAAPSAAPTTAAPTVTRPNTSSHRTNSNIMTTRYISTAPTNIVSSVQSLEGVHFMSIDQLRYVHCCVLESVWQ
jgi:hypothetical protein